MAVANAPLVLIADDDPVVLRALVFRIGGWGCRTAVASDKRELLRAIDREPPAVLLLDVRFGEHDGVELLRALRPRLGPTAVLMMAAFGSIDGAVSAIKHGAFDYLNKPPDLNRLRSLIDEAVLTRGADRKGNAAPEAAEAEADVEAPRGVTLVGRGPAMAKVRELLAAVAPTEASVLILGESGTGKEVVARSIHGQSRRRDRPFVALNMAALPRELVESTLFGHEKGAFTGADRAQAGAAEAADGGTLFLDEVGEMEVSLQAKLLRFLQERTYQRVGSSKPRAVDVRIVAATNRDPLEQVRRGMLREDLYYRLNVVPVVMPTLRSRREDVPSLARYFLERASARYGKAGCAFAPEALDALARYDWPGNVRQLENLVERLVIFCKDGEIGCDAIPPEFLPPADPAVAPAAAAAGDHGARLRPIDRIEKRAIEEALRGAEGRVRGAAKTLGLSQATVYRKLRKYGLRPA